MSAANGSVDRFELGDGSWADIYTGRAARIHRVARAVEWAFTRWAKALDDPEGRQEPPEFMAEVITAMVPSWHLNGEDKTPSPDEIAEADDRVVTRVYQRALELYAEARQADELPKASAETSPVSVPERE